MLQTQNYLLSFKEAFELNLMSSLLIMLQKLYDAVIGFIEISSSPCHILLKFNAVYLNIGVSYGILGSALFVFLH